MMTITDKARELLADQLKTLISGGTHKIGLGGNSTSPASTTLDVPLTVSVSKSVEKSDENVVQVKLEILGSAIQGKVIREAGLFDSASNLLQRINFTGVGPFSSSERLQIYLTMEIE